MKSIRLIEMTSPEVKEAIAKGFTTVVLAVGSHEQHGPHLPLQTDTLMGDAIAYGLARKLGNALQAPTINVGCSDHHMAFAGTISLKITTLIRIITDYIASLEKHGFKTIILFSSHGGNFIPIIGAMTKLRKKFPNLNILGFSTEEELQKISTLFADMVGEFGMGKETASHAGEVETSVILHINGDLVRKNKFVAGYLGGSSPEASKIMNSKGIQALSENGIWGDPRQATSEKGERYIERFVAFAVEIFNEYQKK